MKLYIPILAISLIVCSSCRKQLSGSPDSLVKDEPGAAVQIDSVPLTVGNTWKYLVQRGNNTDTETITVVADTMINGFNAAIVLTDYNGTHSRAYYANKDKAYYMLGYWNAANNSVVILDSPNKLVQFPVAPNTSWTSTGMGANDFNSPYDFKWFGFYTVTTPLGNLNCGKLMFTSSSPILTYQYYTAKGLVKELQLTAIMPQSGSGPSDFKLSGTTTLIYVNF